MPFTFYRGDTRKPAELKNGFQAWVPLTADQAKALAARCNGTNKDKDVAVALPAQAKSLGTAIKGMAGKPIDLGSLGREIKREKSRTTVHISTDVTQSCGGYQGIIYEIVFDKLFGQSQGKWTAPANPIKVNKIKPMLVMDTEGPTDKTTVVAVAIYGVAEKEGQAETTEVAFLTSIPKANIKRYSEDGGKTWKKMP